MRTRNLHLAVLLLPVACGGRSEYDSGQPGSSGSDAGADAVVEASADASHDVEPPPDAGATDSSLLDALTDAPTTFCSGASKLQMAHGTPIEVPVSTGLIAMDCCDAFGIRFHGESSVGMDIEFMFQTFGLMQGGTFELGPGATEYNARASVLGQDEFVSSPVVGELQIETVGPDSAWRVRLCGEVQEPGALLDGTQLFADWITVAPWQWDGRFAVQLLADSSITATDAMELPLDALELGVTVLSLSQLAAYDWSDHALILGSWSTSAGILNHLPTVPVHGLPFVLMVDGERVYLGAFTTLVSSVALPLPSISVDEAPPDRIVIQSAPVGSVDVREDPRVSTVMAEAGKLVP